MSPTMCPGQDTRFWHPQDVFEVPCGQCGYEIEFFKDDTVRRCRRCGARVTNPKLSLGCAQWCEHAEKCLGYDPKKAGDLATGEAASLTDTVIDLLRAQLGPDGVSRPLGWLEAAEELIKAEAGDPKVVLVGALLMPLGREAGLEVLGQVKLDPQAVEQIKDILAGRDEASDEAKLIADAGRLAELNPAQVPDFATGAARVIAARRTA